MFKTISTRFRKSKSHTAKNWIPTALDHLAVLEKSNFFLAYSSFFEEWVEFHDKYAHEVDKDGNFMKPAVESYFRNLFEKSPGFPTITVEFREKNHRGVQVNLKIHTSYYFGLNLNHIIKTFIGWLHLRCNRNRRIRMETNIPCENPWANFFTQIG